MGCPLSCLALCCQALRGLTALPAPLLFHLACCSMIFLKVGTLTEQSSTWEKLFNFYTLQGAGCGFAHSARHFPSLLYFCTVCCTSV